MGGFGTSHPGPQGPASQCPQGPVSLVSTRDNGTSRALDNALGPQSRRVGGGARGIAG